MMMPFNFLFMRPSSLFNIVMLVHAVLILLNLHMLVFYLQVRMRGRKRDMTG